MRVALATIDCRAYKFVRMRVCRPLFPCLPSSLPLPCALACPHAVIAVASGRSVTPMDQPGEQTGIIHAYFWFNNMSTYEESCLFASRPSTHRQQPKSQQEQHRKKRLMKVATLISLAAAVLLASRGFAAPYDDLAAKGYRWVTTNGPYACPSKDDLRQIIQHHTDETELQMIEQPRAYYLIEGAIVQVVLEDAASGMSLIHSAEIGPDVWTLTRFLSRHPIRNTDGEIEVPLRSLTPHR